MTEGISTYKFDFAPEAKALLAGIDGRMAKRIIILETSPFPSWLQITYANIVGDEKLVKKKLAKVQANIKGKLTQAQATASFANSTITWPFGRSFSYISFNGKSQFAGQLGEENRDILNLFTLYHEAGHLLTGNPLNDKKITYKEGTADAYAALRLLQRFGTEAVPFLSQFSWFRAHEAITYNTSHLTTTVLDKIILDSTQQDFAQLEHAQIVKMAKSYAKAFTPGAGTLSKAEKIFKGLQKDIAGNKQPDIATVLQSSSLSARPDNFSFYILAKFAQPFFLGSGEFIYNGAPVKPKYPSFQETIRAHTEARLSQMHLRDVFNRKALAPQNADTPLADAVKISLPAGKPFVFQTKKAVYKP